MTSLTSGGAGNTIRNLMQQIIAERDAKFAPKQEGGEAAPTGGMFDKPEVKTNEADAITDLLGYLEQKRSEALDSYQSKVMRRASKPLPKPEDIDVSSFLSEAGLSPQPDGLTALSFEAPELGAPDLDQVIEAKKVRPSKKPMAEVDVDVIEAAVEQPAGNGLMSSPRPKARTFEIPEYKVYSSPDEMSELEILARTIEAEAATEPYNGKIAVGATIANRAASGKYGASGGIKGVILKPAQFSPWNSYTKGAKGKQGRDMMALKASTDSYRAAMDILKGDYEDPTNGATHYVNESSAEGQSWIDTMKGRKKGTVTIGNHLFGNADDNKTYDGKSWVKARK
jgi:spore germination cell wall hydrolase CwlJ-like protein